MDPKPYKPDTADGIDSVELHEAPPDSVELKESSSQPSAAEKTAGRQTAGKRPAKKGKRGKAGDLGIAISAIVLACVLSVTNYAIAPPSESPRNIGYLAYVPKAGDGWTLLKVKLRLARAMFLPKTLQAANLDVANYYLWIGNFKGAQSYLEDSMASDDDRTALVFYSQIGMKLDLNQFDDAAKIADAWMQIKDGPNGPTRISEFELIRLAYQRAGRQSDAMRLEELMERARFLDHNNPALQPSSKFWNYDEQAAMAAVCTSAEQAMAAGQYREARRFWLFALDSPMNKEGRLSSYELEKARIMLPIASLLVGDKAAAAKEFPEAVKSLNQYSDWFSDTQKNLVYKYYASLLQQQGASAAAAKYEEMSSRFSHPHPVRPWWDEKDPVDPWNEVSL